jgi:hypothetical protein
MAKSCGMGSRWRVAARIVAVASGVVALTAPGTVALASEAVPPGTGATTPAESRPGDPAGVALAVGLSLGGAWPVTVVVDVGGSSATPMGPAEVTVGQLVTIGLSPSQGQDLTGPCPAGGECMSSLDRSEAPAAARPSSTTELGSPNHASSPRTSGNELGTVEGAEACAALGQGQAETDCGAAVLSNGGGGEGGQGSARPPAATEDMVGCSLDCLASMTSGEPLGAVGVDRGEVGQAAGEPPPSGGTTPERSHSTPPLASTGSPVVVGLAGLLLMLLGAFLSWRRAYR